MHLVLNSPEYDKSGDLAGRAVCQRDHEAGDTGAPELREEKVAGPGHAEGCLFDSEDLVDVFFPHEVYRDCIRFSHATSASGLRMYLGARLSISACLPVRIIPRPISATAAAAGRIAESGANNAFSPNIFSISSRY